MHDNWLHIMTEIGPQAAHSKFLFPSLGLSSNHQTPLPTLLASSLPRSFHTNLNNKWRRMRVKNYSEKMYNSCETLFDSLILWDSLSKCFVAQSDSW